MSEQRLARKKFWNASYEEKCRNDNDIVFYDSIIIMKGKLICACRILYFATCNYSDFQENEQCYINSFCLLNITNFDCQAAVVQTVQHEKLATNC